MKNFIITVVMVLTVAITQKVQAQWVVTDPTNLASGILNSATVFSSDKATENNLTFGNSLFNLLFKDLFGSKA